MKIKTMLIFNKFSGERLKEKIAEEKVGKEVVGEGERSEGGVSGPFGAISRSQPHAFATFASR